MKGLALELPFLKLKYLKVQGNGPRTTTGNSIAPDQGEIYTAAKQLYVPAFNSLAVSPQVTTMGPDPMKSRPSVLHELEYGRMSTNTGYNPSGVSAYQGLVPSQITSHVIDTFA